MDKPRHPKGLVVLFLTEMWERFSFYLLLGILYQYLTDDAKGGLGWTGEEAAALVGSYIALVYFTPFVGGLLADRVLGCRLTIVIGGILMMLGQFTLAWPSETGMYLGLGLLILGNGAFKPNISTLLGNLYPPNSPLRDAGYNIFYMGINLGAFFCNFVAAVVRNRFDAAPLYIGSMKIGGWHAAFASAGFGMLIGLTIFLCYYRSFEAADQGPSKQSGPRESLTPFWFQCILPAIILGALAWCLCDPVVMKWFNDKVGKDVLTYKPPFKPDTAAFLAACLPAIVFYIRIWRAVPDAADRGRVGGLLVIFGVVIVFWAVFHLNSTALTAWTRDNTDRVPKGPITLLTDNFEDFSEEAAPTYYYNAPASTPRPDPSTYQVVSEERYKELKDAKKLSVKQGEPLVVTEKMRKEIEKNATEETPRLKPNQQLKLINTEQYNSINAGFVILFTPLIVAFWAWLRRDGREPSTAAKIGLGLLLTAASTLVMWGATYVSGDTKGSSAWLFGTYAVITIGELCLSPMGLSLVNKMSPANIRAFMMGGWFLSTSFGNKLSGIFGEVYEKMDHLQFWPMLAGLSAIAGIVIFLLLPWLNRQMTERK